MQLDRQPRSGLATVKRDFTSNNITDSPHASVPAAATKRSTLSDSLRKAIQDGVASREVDKASPALSSLTASQKRSLSPGAAPSTKKRQLPSSWSDFESSSATIPRGSSQSSVYFKSRSSTSSVLALDMLSHGHQEGPESSSAPSSETKPPQRPAGILLSDEQKSILELVMQGRNIFYTGSAGTGKSVLLREIIKALRKKYVKSPDAVAVTASTGIAACNIGGVTVHSFAGIGLGVENAEKLVEKIMKNRKASSRWHRTQVLIIDEVSMVDGGLFDKLAQIGSMIRKKSEPFGGIQVVITGDFFQLPPVSKGSMPVRFAFEAATWEQTLERAIKLTKVFRQKDEEFVNMLNEMRYGTLSPKSIARFRQLSRDITYEDGIGPTELFPRRQDVDNSNNLRMSRLRGESKTYHAKDGGLANGEQRQKLLDNFMAQQVLHLTVGAQVMLIKNIDETLVNGSMGIVVSFEPFADFGGESSRDRPRNENVYKLQERRYADVPPSELEEASKVGVIKALTLDEARRKRPVVDFNIPGGGIRQVMVEPETWKVELPNGDIQASRTQYPLILAWAMSIHKSQGQTLDRVKVDLAKVFEKGQAYVALSRATSLEGLQVLNFSPNKVFVHEKVKEWSSKLETFDGPILVEDSDDDVIQL